VTLVIDMRIVEDKSFMSSITLAFHAETLHEQRVWKKVERIAGWMAEHNMKATFFVYPFPAAVAGKSISERVQWLGSLGHEIAQHTHFYAGMKIAKHEKRDDLSKANVIHCLRRDFATLKEFGFPPKGFTAGSWFVNDAVLDALVELGFVYDCSALFPRPKTSGPVPNNRWLRAAQYYSNSHGRLLCLPTTCSLGEWFKWGHKARREGDQFYQIVYLHDYDLLPLKGRLLLFCFVRMIKWAPLEQSASVAERCLISGGSLS
jgi:peptidoglycan/xylan/chitin deacetylase (PgdA/CDA1 family)